MKLKEEKVNRDRFYSVGTDQLSGRYVLIDSSSGNELYYQISYEEYLDFDRNINKLNRLHEEFVKQNINHVRYWFSNNEKYNNKAQCQLMLKYMYADIVFGKTKAKIYERIGKPNRENKAQKTDEFQMTKKIRLVLNFDNDVCAGVCVVFTEEDGEQVIV